MRPPFSPIGSVAATVLLLLLGFFGSTAFLAAQTPGGSAPETDTTYFRSYHSTPRDTVSSAVYEGWKQFALYCARCHGDFGVGTSFAPALIESVKPTGTIPTAELFIQTVCAGRLDKGMPAWCALGLDISAMQAIHVYLLERASGKLGVGRPAVFGR